MKWDEMTTQRKKTKATARKGVNFVRSIVEARNSIFQEVELENDIGNDAYVEFIEGEDGTGCCITSQIKSGDSYVRDHGKDLVITADRDHFEYWNSHVLPVAGIVFDPDHNLARWINISLYLDEHPGIVQDGPYVIHIPQDQDFSAATFEDFKSHFLAYSRSYRTRDAFARAVESFADSNDIDESSAALRALFYYHRNKKACWYIFMSSLPYCRHRKLLEGLTYYLTLVPGHGDIYWHKDNLIEPAIRQWAEGFMREHFGRREIEALVTAIDPEQGIGRGTIGQCAHAIIDILPSRNTHLAQIVRDVEVGESVRWHSLILLLYDLQFEELETALATAADYRRAYADSRFTHVLDEIITMLRDGSGFSIY